MTSTCIKQSGALLTRTKQKLPLSSFEDVGTFINMPSKVLFLKSHEKKVKNTQPNSVHNTVSFQKTYCSRKKCTHRQNNTFNNPQKIPTLKINCVGVKATETSFHLQNKPKNEKELIHWLQPKLQQTKFYLKIKTFAPLKNSIRANTANLSSPSTF